MSKPSYSYLLLSTLLLLTIFIAHVSCEDVDDEEDVEDYSKVTYGSAIKLRHKQSGFHLHSHSIKWGSGSGQQSVTGFEGTDDPNSLWQVVEPYPAAGKTQPAQPVGTTVKCGDIIRLQHSATKRYLHSHLHSSPLTHRQEISCYGEESQQDGKTSITSDTGDNWKVECLGAKQEWARDASVSLVHVDTEKRLYTRRVDMFDHNNCRGCPIVGQLEISAHTSPINDGNTLWTVSDDSGIFFPVTQ